MKAKLATPPPKPKRGAPTLFNIKLRRVLVTLDESSVARASKLGEGNVSAGIRIALMSAGRHHG